MRTRAFTAALLALALVLSAAVGVDSATAAKRPSRAAKKLRLVSFDRCSDLVGYARRYADRVEPYYSPPGLVPTDTIVAPQPPSPGEDTAVAGGQGTGAP